MKMNKREKDSDWEEVEGELKGFLEAIDLDDKNDEIEYLNLWRTMLFSSTLYVISRSF